MQKITITHPSDAGQRIDRFCKKYLPNAALGGIYKMLRTGKIKVNGKKKDQMYKIEIDDEITFWMSDAEIAELKIQNSKFKIQNNDTHIENTGNLVPQSGINNLESGIRTSLDILYEDEYLMVINKPAGLNVHAGDHKTRESNLIDQVQDYLGSKYDSLTFRPALVHRIDRDTSGCIIIAKQKNVLESLLESLQSHKIEKVYHALVFGIPEKREDTIRARLLRIEDAHDEAKVRVDDAGQSAVTHYKVLKSRGLKVESKKTEIQEYGALKTQSGIDISLLECQIETGRTHQIRVHLSHVGYPIVGDKTYGNKKYNAYMTRKHGLYRQMLHARSLEFSHPIIKKSIFIEAPYYPEFTVLIDLIDNEKS